MKVVEIKQEENVWCPVCNHIVFTADGESEPDGCSHTLLIATDEGIEFCAGVLDEESLENKAEESSWDEVILGIGNPKATLIKLYDGAPSFMGAYYLFEE